MKLNKIIFICTIYFILAGCKQNSLVGMYQKKFGASKILFVSCRQCDCINTELEKIFKADSNVFNSYLFVGDTNCLKHYNFKTEIIHVNQLSIDSMDIENSNLTIINNNKLIRVRSKDNYKIKAWL